MQSLLDTVAAEISSDSGKGFRNVQKLHILISAKCWKLQWQFSMFFFNYYYFYLNNRIFSSGITWVLVYRTEKYKRLKAEVEKQSKKRK